MLDVFLQRLRAGETDFEETIALINTLYDYTPTRFSNGLSDVLVSEAGQNEGSCRVFAFARLNGLSREDTLACFGRHYRDVLAEPDGQSHGNIRRFMRDGWDGIYFDGEALARKSTLQPGDTGKASMTVTDADTAKALSPLSGDDFPEVYATSRMVAIMELSAARCLVPMLQSGQLSVGVDVNIRHLAATPKGETVEAVATFEGMEGKLFRFRIEAFDRGGKIGEGTHTRAIILTERLLDGAHKRIAG